MSDFNDQQAWGGGPFQSFQPSVDRSSPLHQGRQGTGLPPSHAGLLASNSDNIFHPTLNTVPVPSSYNLPDVPFHRNYPAYMPSFPHIPMRREHLSQPANYILPTSSYNNPNFVAPPSTPLRNDYNHVPSSPPFIPHTPSPHPQIPFPQHQQYPQTNLPHQAPVQYVYYVPQTVPSPSHSPSIPVSFSASKNLPTVSHVPVLTNKADFFVWDEGITSLLRANGLIGHILDPAEPLDPARPDRVPNVMPVLPLLPTPADVTSLTRWWDDDNIAQHVLTSRIGSVPRGLLPSPNLVTRTALSIYQTLVRYYGTCNFADCAELFNSLNGLYCQAGRLQEYVSKWRTGLSRLQSARFPFSIKLSISQFIRGLPVHPAFNTLRAALPAHVSAAGDQDYGFFVNITETALELETIFRSASQHVPRSSRQLPGPVPSPMTTDSVPKPHPSLVPNHNIQQGKAAPLPHESGSAKICSNCGKRGHLQGTCFEPGGGMEGRRDEYRRDRSKMVAMLVASLDEAYGDTGDIFSDDPAIITPPYPSDPPPIESPVTTLPVSDSVSQQNDNISRDWYPMRDSGISFVPSTSPPVDHVAFFSLGQRFNACLDSGCTDHIVRSRDLFHTYDTSGAVEVGTANCGSLSAKATGDVRIRFPYQNRTAFFTLRGCLHAPDAPINLLSVGALTEAGLTISFTPNTPTLISYPLSDPDLPGFSISATVVRRLSLLCLDFVPPPAVSPIPQAYPAFTFPKTLHNSTLWHRRFGHLGMDATREVLTKDYATGIQYTGPFVHDQCVACIVGKSPQHSYSHNGRRASKVGELIHMDMCGPYPVKTPDGKQHFFVILDDSSNFGVTDLLRARNDAYSSYCRTENYFLRSFDAKVITVRVDGALELTKGSLGAHFEKQGIVVQRTAAYAHQQNGKIERYVRTIEEGGQTLLADSGLSMSFWGWAVLTSQYLRNRLPTSTLPVNMTPIEAISSKKPDLSHLRVWGCQCFVTIPPELRAKAGPRRFEAIFVGYEEHRIGWTVRDLKGRIHFSRDIIFNEDLSGRLGVPRSISPRVNVDPHSPSIRPIRTRIQTIAGRDYDEALQLRRSLALERTKARLARHGGADVVAAGGANVVADGVALAVVANGSHGTRDRDLWHLADSTLEDFVSYLASSRFPDQTDTDSLALDEHDIFWTHCLSVFQRSLSDLLDPIALGASAPVRYQQSPSYDLSKEPNSYAEAMSRPDADAWRAAMDREKTSLEEMGAFEEVDLPKGERLIGLKWVYAYKKNSDGVNILEKARVVAQGFNQKPGQFDETYAPVAKMASVRVLLAWAAVHDLDIFQFDCKTAFLHAKLRHPNYARQFPGYTFTTPDKVLRIKVALYGLRQSAYEFYTLFMSLILDLGMVRCEVDHGIFFGEWLSPPDSSVVMPSNGDPLRMYTPIHVDDGLAITNSPSLYQWFLRTLRRKLLIVDLGECSKFLSIVLYRDRANRRLWMSSHIYVHELLAEWGLLNATYPKTPFPHNITVQSAVPSNALPQVSDLDLTAQYQRLVGCLMYLAVATRPDIAYYAMWLGQFSAKPSRFHMLSAKHVLRYLGGTKLLALSLGNSSSPVPDSLRGFLQNMGCSDADWASDAVDRKSISGYSFFFLGSLVSWSAVKQKSIALSSTEAEYYAMTHAFKEALWLRVFLGFLNFPIPRPFPILSDNQAACSLSNSLAISARSKHIDIRHHFIRAHVLDGSFSTTWIPTADMPADIFTKPLNSILFTRHRDVLGLSIPLSS